MTALLWALLDLALAAAASLVLVSTALLALAFIFGAPFVPTSRDRVAAMVRLAAPKAGELWVDLGSGDGRILVAAAETGVRTIGYEFHPVLVLLSRFTIFRHGLRGRASVRLEDLWGADLSKADIVSLYLIPHRMEQMKAKLFAELRPGCRVVSNAYEFDGWAPQTREDSISLYVRP